MWEYVLGGATVFGLIVGLSSFYNGRVTRRLILEEERRTREFMGAHFGRRKENPRTDGQAARKAFRAARSYDRALREDAAPYFVGRVKQTL